MNFLNWLSSYGHIVFFIFFLLIYTLFSLAAFYHCREYGYAGDATNIMMVIYSLVSVVIIVGTFYFLLMS